MVRIVFENGEVADCDHIAKVFYEEQEHDKVSMVCSLEVCTPPEDNGELILDQEEGYDY